MSALTGRCYCGALHVGTKASPQTVAYCHCSDCRRLSGAPVAAFAAFDPAHVVITPRWPDAKSHAKGVKRWFCPECGTQLGATYDYLPDQVYMPVGLFDQADRLQPQLHSHADSALPWLHIDDGLPRNAASSRASLTMASCDS
ncbi:GFA family protein [Cognatiyoonia sp. IB215446]|uniref:GFA family protein n=1 Tax=Cognatiyoonia sp. IB215446 TaxID=3097355 RepID=UPI002A126F5B|nr:GFA family protein [Cognatiyoonia sp. IB215446]MDX8347038.1 GFA family protein [Cognatiyoonia sp. IB215446]